MVTGLLSSSYSDLGGFFAGGRVDRRPAAITRDLQMGMGRDESVQG